MKPAIPRHITTKACTLAGAVMLLACQPPRITPRELLARYEACATEKLNGIQYMGSDGKDHHFHHMRLSMRRIIYRVPRDQLSVSDEFALSDEPAQWRHYRIHAIDAVGSGGVLLIPAAESDRIPWRPAPVIEGLQVLPR